MNIFWLGIMGVAMLFFGVYIRAGRARAWYVVKPSWRVGFESVRNGLIPLGITLIVWEITLSDLVPDKSARSSLFFWLIMPMFLISVLLSLWGPRWLKPKWLAHLEGKYGKALTRRLLDKGLEDYRHWEKRTRTQEGLEKWAKDALQILDYPPNSRIVKREAVGWKWWWDE